MSVPIPPPPGRVEVVRSPPAALKSPVWIDGEWVWTGRRWQWKDGRWEDAPPGMLFAPAITVRRDDGTLAHFPGHWKKDPDAK